MDAPRCPAGSVTVSDSSDTYRRIGPDSEKLPRAFCLCAAQRRSPGGERCIGCCSPLDTDCNLPWVNRDITTHFSFSTTIMRQAPRVNPTGGLSSPDAGGPERGAELKARATRCESAQ